MTALVRKDLNGQIASETGSEAVDHYFGLVELPSGGMEEIVSSNFDLEIIRLVGGVANDTQSPRLVLEHREDMIHLDSGAFVAARPL